MQNYNYINFLFERPQLILDAMNKKSSNATIELITKWNIAQHKNIPIDLTPIEITDKFIRNFTSSAVYEKTYNIITGSFYTHNRENEVTFRICAYKDFVICTVAMLTVCTFIQSCTCTIDYACDILYNLYKFKEV